MSEHEPYTWQEMKLFLDSVDGMDEKLKLLRQWEKQLSAHENLAEADEDWRRWWWNEKERIVYENPGIGYTAISVEISPLNFSALAIEPEEMKTLLDSNQLEEIESIRELREAIQYEKVNTENRRGTIYQRLPECEKRRIRNLISELDGGKRKVNKAISILGYVPTHKELSEITGVSERQVNRVLNGT